MMICEGCEVEFDPEDEPHRCAHPVPCSYPGCLRTTNYDPVYDDLCYEHVRVRNE